MSSAPSYSFSVPAEQFFRGPADRQPPKSPLKQWKTVRQGKKGHLRTMAMLLPRSVALSLQPTSSQQSAITRPAYPVPAPDTFTGALPEWDTETGDEWQRQVSLGVRVIELTRVRILQFRPKFSRLAVQREDVVRQSPIRQNVAYNCCKSLECEKKIFASYDANSDAASRIIDQSCLKRMAIFNYRVSLWLEYCDLMPQQSIW